MAGKLDEQTKVLAAAGGFTGLWALTWLGSSVMGAGGVATGAFGVGTVMSGSGLTALWWKTRLLKEHHADADEPENDSHVGRAHRE